MASKTKIVFFNVCARASRFKSRTKAEEAAEIYSQQARYGCEAFLCEKQHPTKNGRPVGDCWHVRGVRRPGTAEKIETRVARARATECSPGSPISH
jgi:hypothetical protein